MCDEKFIEEKARELYEMCSYTDRQYGFMYAISINSAKDFIRQLYEEMPAKKATVSEEFVKKWADIIHQADTSLFGIKGELKND